MPYHLTTQRLNTYNCSRINPTMVGRTHNLITATLFEDAKCVELVDPRGDKFVLSASYVPVPLAKGYDLMRSLQN